MTMKNIFSETANPRVVNLGFKTQFIGPIVRFPCKWQNLAINLLNEFTSRHFWFATTDRINPNQKQKHSVCCFASRTNLFRIRKVSKTIKLLMRAESTAVVHCQNMASFHYVYFPARHIVESLNLIHHAGIILPSHWSRCDFYLLCQRVLFSCPPTLHAPTK